jgi:hypothetical protein
MTNDKHERDRKEAPLRDREHIDKRGPLESALEEPGGATGAPEAEVASDITEGRDVD